MSSPLLLANKIEHIGSILDMQRSQCFETLDGDPILILMARFCVKRRKLAASVSQSIGYVSYLDHRGDILPRLCYGWLCANIIKSPTLQPA